ncbi:MAG: EI24 domain-containing protein [Pseudomonadota bacterium]
MALGVILSSFGRALAQAGDRRFLRVLLIGVGLTIALLLGLSWLVVWGVGALVPNNVSLPFGLSIGWLDEAASALSLIGVLLLSIVLMVPVASAFTGIFLDDVAAAVEDRYYPYLPAPPPLPLGETIRDSIGFLWLIVVVNAIALVLYFIVGPFAPLLFWAVNGFLLGREYFQLVAMRRLGRAGAIAARRRHGGVIWFAGILMAAPLTIPIVNLFVPILGAATFTHIFHALEDAR